MATKKKENAVPEIIDNVEALEAKMKAMREAQLELQQSADLGMQELFWIASIKEKFIMTS